MNYYRIIRGSNDLLPTIPQKDYLVITTTTKWVTVATTKGWEEVRLEFPDYIVGKTTEAMT